MSDSTTEPVRLVQRALDLGVTHIDTADAYGFGRSEELVGKAIAGRRDEVVLATKGSKLFGEYGTDISNDPTYMRGALERSLTRLNVDYVDLYYIHHRDPATPADEAFGALMDFKSEGLIRAAGISNFDPDALRVAATAGPIDAVQQRYNLLQREREADVVPWCVENGISFIPWGGLAYGLLGGRYGRDFALDPNDWRHRSGVFGDDVLQDNLDVVDELKLLAADGGTTPAALAMQWLMSRPGVDSVIAGAKRVDQVTDNVAVEGISVTDAQLAAVDALTAS